MPCWRRSEWRRICCWDRGAVPARKPVLDALADGSAKIVIGTHALISESVTYHDLGLAVVDEQHRFGVRQRVLLGQKGEGVDVIVMTATPIPRSLAMTAYGDLDHSRLDEKPAGRLPIDTRALPLDRLSDVVERLRAALAHGKRAYWICPLVEESEKLDVAAAEDRQAALARALPDAEVALAHGKMKAGERDDAMQRFRDGTAQLLVATTVVEVGVDAGGQRHHYRACRAVWPGPASSASRPGRAKRRRFILSATVSGSLVRHGDVTPVRDARDQ